MFLLGYEEGLCPRAEEFYRRVFTLPIFPGLSEVDLEQVVETLVAVCREVLGS